MFVENDAVQVNSEASLSVKSLSDKAVEAVGNT